MKKPTSLIDLFTRHKVASNLLMVIMVLMGIWGISHIHTQLNPPHSSDSISIDIDWPGASAEDVERLITLPIEYQMRTLEDMREQNSTSTNSHSSIYLYFNRKANMSDALDSVKQQLAQVRDMPTGIEPAIVRISQRKELVAMVLLTGKGSVSQLSSLARQYQRELLARGIDSIDIQAMPEEEITLGRVVKLSLTLPSIDGVVAAPIQSVYDYERVFLVEGDRLRGVEIDVVGERIDQSGKLELLISSRELHNGQKMMVSQLSQAITGLKVKQIAQAEEPLDVKNAIASITNKDTI